jgi:hypothetical protein
LRSFHAPKSFEDSTGTGLDLVSEAVHLAEFALEGRKVALAERNVQVSPTEPMEGCTKACLPARRR